MEANIQVDNKFSRLRDMVMHIKIAMLNTLDENGNFISRPMAAQKVDDDGIIWFFTKKDSSQVSETEKDKRVNLAFSNPDKQLYVSISGAAREYDDKEKINELWNPGLKAWYPYGKDDPQLTLLRVEIHKGEYWDIPSNKMAELYNIVKTNPGNETFQASETGTISIDEAHNDPSLLTVPFKIDSFL